MHSQLPRHANVTRTTRPRSAMKKAAGFKPAAGRLSSLRASEHRLVGYPETLSAVNAWGVCRWSAAERAKAERVVTEFAALADRLTTLADGRRAWWRRLLV